MTSIAEDALRICCSTYEESSIEQQKKIKAKDKLIRKQRQRIERLENIIKNNVKKGHTFL